MKLEQQLTNLDLSRELKKLKVKQESVWYWSRIASGSGKKGQITKAKLLPDWEIQPELTEADGVYRYSAFTTAELGEMLPKNIIQERTDKAFILGFVDESHKHIERDKTEANARAEMLIYLLKNGLIKNNAKTIKR